MRHKERLHEVAILTKYSILVWLGTLNTILILLFGSFAQQALQLPTREHNLESTGTIERSVQYRATPISENSSTLPAPNKCC